MLIDIPICNSCRFKIRLSRCIIIGGEQVYFDVVCNHPDIDNIIPIPDLCKNYECKYHEVTKDQKTLERYYEIC